MKRENLKYRIVLVVFIIVLLIFLSTIISIGEHQSRNSAETPVAVNLKKPTNITTDSMVLSWTKSKDVNFSAYKLYRDTKPKVGQSSTLVTTVNIISILSFQDTSLHERTTYYYKVYVQNKNGSSNGSNEVNGTTKNKAPTAITLFEPSILTKNSITLSWSECTDPDFESYKLYRSQTSGVDDTSLLIAIINVSSTLTFNDIGLLPVTTYYYRIYVVDNGSLSTASNEVEGTTLHDPGAKNLSPIADAGNGQTVEVTDEVEFIGTGQDLDGIIVKYEWDFDGDGEFDWENPNTGSTSYKYEDSGKYIATLRITDNDGTTASDTVIIEVKKKEEEPATPGFEIILFISAVVISLMILKKIKF